MDPVPDPVTTTGVRVDTRVPESELNAVVGGGLDDSDAGRSGLAVVSMPGVADDELVLVVVDLVILAVVARVVVADVAARGVDFVVVAVAVVVEVVGGVVDVV